MEKSSGLGFPGYLMSYDEMRTGHTCELCASHGDTGKRNLTTTVAATLLLWIDLTFPVCLSVCLSAPNPIPFSADS